MTAMTRARAVPSPVVASLDTGASSETYEGALLDGAEEKLIPPADAIMFCCRVARLRTRPVKITGAEGCVKIVWSNYAPRAFRGRILNLVGNCEFIDMLTVQENRALAGDAVALDGNMAVESRVPLQKGNCRGLPDLRIWF